MIVDKYSPYRGSSVLVTGGSGFIGHHLVSALRNVGASVTVVDVEVNQAKRVAGVKYIVKNILEDNIFDNTSNKFDFIFHLAARTDLDGESIEDYKTNHKGTLNLLRQLDPKIINKFILYSTQLVTGIFNEKRFVHPSEPYRTNTLYGRSKILAEIITKKYCAIKSIPFTIIRPTSVFGPGGKVPYRDYFLTIKKGQYFHVGRADNLISMCYVENLIELTLLVGAKKSANGCVYYGNDLYPYTMREFSDKAANHLGVNIRTLPYSLVFIGSHILGMFKSVGLNVPLYPARLKNITATYCYDLTNAITLGYIAKIDLNEAMKKTIRWYLKNDKDFNS